MFETTMQIAVNSEIVRMRDVGAALKTGLAIGEVLAEVKVRGGFDTVIVPGGLGGLINPIDKLRSGFFSWCVLELMCSPPILPNVFRPFWSALVSLLLGCLALPGFAEGAETGSRGAVTLADDGGGFLLSNGEITARIEKRTGGVVSLQYRGMDLLARGGGYWSFAGSGAHFGALAAATVRIDPKSNGGERAEVACRLAFDQKAGSLPVDIEIRYALGRGEHWLYTYAVWNHPATYPGVSLGEGRFAMKLNPQIFDYMTVDARRRRVMPTGADWDRGAPLNIKEARRLTTGTHAGEAEHKYDYSAVLAETPAYGWSSTSRHVGLWIVNPSLESISGGPTKVELTGHLDVNPGGLPTLLNMWLGSHYGGSSLAIAQGEVWTKVVGPFLLYCNQAPEHEAMWKDALAQASRESAAWPYAWVTDPNYPPAAGRGSVSGTLKLKDPYVTQTQISNLQVGVSAPDYTAPAGRGSFAKVDWQRDAKYYQFWSCADSDGHFSIANIRPGTYTLHAFADGVLGEFSKANVTIRPGQPLDLGELVWIPERFGRPLWEIGIPNRSAEEFRHGDDYWHWGLYLKYPEEFPDDVNFTIGKSDWRKDWNYCQPPRLTPEGNFQRESTWTINFNLTEVPVGPLTLRLSFCGARAGTHVTVKVNGDYVGETGPLPEDGVMHRDGIRGDWFEKNLIFAPSHLKVGANNIQLTCHSMVWHQAVMYDYLRLEVADGK